MLYWLLYEQLHTTVRAFNVFRYVTARTMFASLTSFFLCVMLGPWLIQKLRQFQIGQHIREDGPKSHQKKAGTPTMGGVLIIVSIIVPTLLWADLRHQYVWIAMFALLAYGAIGFLDDYAKVAKKQNLGLTAKQKFALQMAVAAVITGWLASMRGNGGYTTVLNVPFFKQFQPDLLIHSMLGNPWTAVLAALLFVLCVCGGGVEQRREHYGRPGWSGDWPDGDFGGCADGVCVYDGEQGTGRVPVAGPKSAYS